MKDRKISIFVPQKNVSKSKVNDQNPNFENISIRRSRQSKRRSAPHLCGAWLVVGPTATSLTGRCRSRCGRWKRSLSWDWSVTYLFSRRRRSAGVHPGRRSSSLLPRASGTVWHRRRGKTPSLLLHVPVDVTDGESRCGAASETARSSSSDRCELTNNANLIPTAAVFHTHALRLGHCSHHCVLINEAKLLLLFRSLPST